MTIITGVSLGLRALSRWMRSATVHRLRAMSSGNAVSSFSFSSPLLPLLSLLHSPLYIHHYSSLSFFFLFLSRLYRGDARHDSHAINIRSHYFLDSMLIVLRYIAGGQIQMTFMSSPIARLSTSRLTKWEVIHFPVLNTTVHLVGDKFLSLKVRLMSRWNKTGESRVGKIRESRGDEEANSCSRHCLANGRERPDLSFLLLSRKEPHIARVVHLSGRVLHERLTGAPVTFAVYFMRALTYV